MSLISFDTLHVIVFVCSTVYKLFAFEENEVENIDDTCSNEEGYNCSEEVSGEKALIAIIIHGALEGNWEHSQLTI